MIITTVTGEREMKDISQEYHRTFVLMGYLTTPPGPNPAETPGERSELRAQTRPCVPQSAREQGGT